MREDIRIWLEALRSGKYKQAEGALQVGDGYCCLGVYCVLNNISFIPAVIDENDNPHERNQEVYDKLRDLIGFDETETGIDMNDNGKSFSEIADFLEKEYFNA